MKNRLYHVLLNFALALAASLFALGAGELALRTFDLTGVHPHQPHRLLTQHDPLLGWSKIPGKVGTHVTDEYEITEHINSRGIRGPEYPYRKPDDEFRILILGDSFAEGYSVEFDELFSEILKTELNTDPQRRYQVINAGTGGYSTDQQLLWFQTEGKLYFPNLTVLAFYFNDIWYNQSSTYWRGAKPLFELDHDRLILTNIPLPKPDHIDSSTRSFLKETKSWLIQNSYLYAAMRQTGKSYAPLRSVGEWFGLIEKGSEQIGNEFLVFRRPYTDHIQRAWVMTEALIRQLKRDAAEIGSALFVLYIPTRFSIYTEEWDAVVQQHALPEELWQYKWPAVELAAVCEKLDIQFIDLTPAFQEFANAWSSDGRRLYHAIDGHWNAEGHRLAARVLVEHVEGTRGF